jgi:hypothetical protein
LNGRPGEGNVPPDLIFRELTMGARLMNARKKAKRLRHREARAKLAAATQQDEGGAKKAPARPRPAR